ncbi:MAG: FHA domain-containing protein [Methanoregula sp.]
MTDSRKDVKTVSISADPQFLVELSEYLEVLSHPARLTILKFIGGGPKEITAIADHIGMSYQNAKKHLDRLVATGLVTRSAGFGRETNRGIAPVWKYSLVAGAMEGLVATLGVFSSVTAQPGYQDIHKRIRLVREAVTGTEGAPVLSLLNGPDEGRTFLVRESRISVGRDDPDHPVPPGDAVIILPDHYRAVTRVTKPQAVISRSGDSWLVRDGGSTGGTFVNSRKIGPGEGTVLETGDVIDLGVGAHAARLLFVAGE